jgi:hypothetical protein
VRRTISAATAHHPARDEMVNERWTHCAQFG